MKNMIQFDTYLKPEP